MTMSMTPGQPPHPHPRKMFKVLCPIEKPDGSTSHWIRVGTAFPNRDQSFNLYLDVFPKNGKLQMRELDEEELSRNGNGNGARRRGEQRTLPAVKAANDETLPF
jgi:hypothetical protein